MELSQFYEKLDVCKKDSESTIFIYDTSALIDIYCRYGKKFFSEKLLKEGMHIIPGKVIEELKNKRSYQIMNLIYQRDAEQLMTIQSSKLPGDLEGRLPKILKGVSPFNNSRIGEGDKETIALALLFSGESVRILSTDSDIPNLITGLNLTKKNVKYINTRLL